MANVYVKDGGNWNAAKEIFVKDGGSWRTIKEVWVNVSGTWQKTFPESTGTDTYTTPGTTNWTVPNGIYSLTVSVYVGVGSGY